MISIGSDVSVAALGSRVYCLSSTELGLYGAIIVPPVYCLSVTGLDLYGAIIVPPVYCLSVIRLELYGAIIVPPVYCLSVTGLELYGAIIVPPVYCLSVTEFIACLSLPVFYCLPLSWSFMVPLYLHVVSPVVTQFQRQEGKSEVHG